MRAFFSQAAAAALLAGGLLLLIGVWFLFAKAGLPYQDPTPEMTIRWMAYLHSGKICLAWGARLVVLGAIGRLIGRKKK